MREVKEKRAGERIVRDRVREVREKQAGERVVEMPEKETLGGRKEVMKRRKTLWKVGYRNAPP